MVGLFHDLKRPQRDKLDLLTTSVEFTVLAVDEEHQMVHVDAPVSDHVASSWSWDGQAVEVSCLDGALLTFKQLPPLDFGHALTQHHVTSAVSKIHQALLDYWQGTWCTWSAVDDATWTRVINLFAAHVARVGFQLDPISLPMWGRALRRFKPLQPEVLRTCCIICICQMLGLPDFLILSTRLSWGLLFGLQQSCDYGIVNLLAKDPGATTIDRFRPVVVFSVIYRNWASLRARQLLRQLSAHMPVKLMVFDLDMNPASFGCFCKRKLKVPYKATVPCAGSLLIWCVPLTTFPGNIPSIWQSTWEFLHVSFSLGGLFCRIVGEPLSFVALIAN
eukprot:s2101_g5.t1